MNDDVDREILLKEWEQRYETYRSFMRLYITSISIVFTIWILGLAFTLRDDVPDRDRPYVLGFLTIMMCIYFAVHLFARKEIRMLGDRIEKLERSLPIEPYRTTRTLERALKYTIVTICIAVLLSLFLTIRSIGGG